MQRYPLLRRSKEIITLTVLTLLPVCLKDEISPQQLRNFAGKKAPTVIKTEPVIGTSLVIKIMQGYNVLNMITMTLLIYAILAISCVTQTEPSLRSSAIAKE